MKPGDDSCPVEWLEAADHADRVDKAEYDASWTCSSCAMRPPADHPDRWGREEYVEAAYKCRECARPWVVFVFEGDPPDDHRLCRFCGAEDAVRVR